MRLHKYTPLRDFDYSDDQDLIPTKDRKTFHWSDYLVFGILLGMYVLIGVYQAVKNAFFSKKQEDTEEFLVGGRSMSIIPVALSILSAFLSAILILGTPAEIYTEGTQYWMYVWGQMFSVILATLLFVPLLYPLRLTSSYEVRMWLQMVVCRMKCLSEGPFKEGINPH